MKKIKKEFEKLKKDRKKHKKKNDNQTNREMKTKTLEPVDDQKKQMTIINYHKNQIENKIYQTHKKIMSSEMDINDNNNNIKFLKKNLGQITYIDEKSDLNINVPKERKIIGFRLQKIERLKTNSKKTKSNYSDKNINKNRLNFDADNFSLKNARPFKITSCYSNNNNLNNSNNKPTNNSLSKTGVYFKKKFNIRFSANSLTNSVYSRQSSCESSDSDGKEYFTSLKKLKNINEKEKVPVNIRITKIDEVNGNGIMKTKFSEHLNNFKVGYAVNSMKVFNDK